MSEFTLQQRYRVVTQMELTMPDVRALTQVYLPIIGHEAFTLYLTLACYPHDENRTFIHTDLLDQAGLTHHSFLDARAHLEGIGLMRTYQQDLTAGTQWVYELLEPMSTREFLADDTLASLLAHYLGETTLNKLISDTVPTAPQIPGKNVTASFFDLIGAESFKRIKSTVTPPERKSAAQKSIQADDNHKLDLDLLFNMLRSFNVSMRTLKENEAALVVEKELYGLDDIALVRLIQQNLDANNEIDMSRLRKSLQQQAQKAQRAPVSDPLAETTTNTSQQTSANTNNKELTATQRFMQQVKSTAPVTFLTALRHEKGGFVTDNELKALQDISQLKRLPNEVINIMLYELTIVENKTTLSRSLMQTIVNDWTQAGIKTAEDALKYLQARQNKKQATQKTTQRRYNGRATKNETQPDWENQRVQAASAQEQAQAADQLAKLRAKRQQQQEENQS